MEILEHLDSFIKQRQVEQNNGQSRSYADRTCVDPPKSAWQVSLQVEHTIYLRARNIKTTATISTNPQIHIQPLFQPCIPILYPCTKPPQETAREKGTLSNVPLLSFAIHQSA